MKRYLSILYAFFKASLVADLEFRANITIRVLADLLWYVAQILTFEVLFHHTNQLGGWQIEQMRVFMAMLFVVDALYMVFLSENMDQLGIKVVKGELDFLLAKPIDSQFMTSFMRMNTPYILNIFLVSCALLWALVNLPGGVPWGRLPLLLIAIPAGVIVMYFTKLVFAASALFFGNVGNIQQVWYQLYRMGTRPDTIYPRWLRFVVLAIIPVGFIASVPTRVILESDPMPLVTALLVMSFFMIKLSRWYWRLALSRYTSASS